MNIRFYNAKLLTMEEPLEITEGELWVSGNKIEYLGPPCENSRTWDRDIDVMGNLLMPGFKNAHTHSAMTFLRSYADDLPLSEWLTHQVYPMEAKLVSGDIYWLSILAIMEYLSSGITANGDMYFHPRAIAEASVDCGFRTVIISPFNNFCSSIAEMEEDYHHFSDDHELVSFCFGFHAEYTTSVENMKKLSALAQKYRAPVFAHNSETRAEVEACFQRHRMSPTALMDSLGLFAYGGGGYHCVYLNDEDIALFRDKGLWAVINSGSNVKLASGIAPVARMLENHVPLALGTDGPASNNCLDMFREMFLTTGLSKIREKDAASLPPEEVLKMAASGGACALGLTDCRSLKKGHLADLIMIDLQRPNMQPENNIIKNIVYSGSKENVKMTMVNGQILYENGDFFIKKDPREVYEQANNIISRIAGRPQPFRSAPEPGFVR